MPRRRKEIIRIIEQAKAGQTPVLDLSNCNAGEFIEEICRMNWLVELKLSHCHLNTLPETIGNLTRLTRLVLAENQLSTLPDSITRLTALQHLDLNMAGYEFKVSDEV